jgi:hypothetical protein
MFTTKHRTPALLATSILTATMVCLSLAGCTLHYNHRGETIGGPAHIRVPHPSIITGVLHGGRR